ncbi:MAG TPA: MFS transporter [Candidatus Sulfomarinibacteraceae bacterium]|nr:MFS transporter [Candidatus Sulfomarinibacteraceae bacterium]
MTDASPTDAPKSPLREIVQPFIDLVRAPRALWGVNLAYVLEGTAYFGVLSYLAIYFSDFVFTGVANPDVPAGLMVGVLTAGITLSMFFLGFVADKFGVRRALIWAFLLLLTGRLFIAGAGYVFEPSGLWSTLHVTTMAGIVFIVIGYGMYQPAAYTAVRQFTNPKTAGMAFAMLYALMNLGGWLPTFAFLLRDDDYLGLGIGGVFWVYAAMTVAALLITVVLLNRKTVADAIATAKAETAAIKRAERGEAEPTAAEASAAAAAEEAAVDPAATLVGFWANAKDWAVNHPFTDLKFTFFIFALIPVQTLFAYNWLVLPPYINRAYEGWIGEYFEIAANFNPILIFFFAPIVAALTQKRKVYTMMIAGTFIMAAPAFLLTLGTNGWLLFAYLLIMTVGEAMWQPRFLQYAAEIAPEGRTGVYMGVAQFPWFLTKLIVPLYSGTLLATYVPAEGPKSPETLWLISACIAMLSTIILFAARGWVGKDFKTKADD